ncbi:hypothetical protein DI392_15885 [Vibrio albus]|uniref:Uncharacterized protein n=2 Tax=Vibrio albus TaxID=2200953 RepID=A0A2U3B6U8_9VIBR|nr:hypothetical protein DI392_15885 [Vibrio albus]
MHDRIVWVESGSVYCRKSSIPMKVKNIEEIYVKEYDLKNKMKRSSLISLVFSFPFFLIHPFIGAFILPILFWGSYKLTKKYELRVTIFNNSDIGCVESGLCSSNYRDEFDDVILQVKLSQQV